MQDQMKSTATRDQDQKEEDGAFWIARLKDEKEYHCMSTKTKRGGGPNFLEQQQEDQRRKNTTARNQNQEEEDGTLWSIINMIERGGAPPHEHQDQKEEEDQSLWSSNKKIEIGETLPHETKVLGKGVA
jgi:hypothetical protein